MPSAKDYSVLHREQLTLLLRIKSELDEPTPTLRRAIEDLKIKMDDEDVKKVEEILQIKS